ncbi:acyl carrier protein [Paenibacillus sp. MZ03-122A]|uniref:acyl carrier protein n=1 Tax=Paenibacillus sp. MZ03-122A TaxID=2962033 RepID=UPI0020B704CF|nr:acyl carrier protein [Paenibacillus sp. MZ03-122A]MCP3778717.1 acyl carrier protein [Paenibacillus sp. MZ03-122A]
MAKLDVKNEFIKLIEERVQLNIDQHLDEDLIVLGLNSILFIQLVVAVEAHFGISFEDEDLVIDKFNTCIDIIQYIESRMRAH